ncbi:hemerythrin domain-containing protein [Streptomyces sp. A5-4]|uniref:hemerythrin domain-containing protein n=1 Tax=Streptomyces sp. A5-4 TaxID=3384771 RepID=UPI003DA7CDDB
MAAVDTRNSADTPDTDEMVLVHRLFLREYGSAAPLVRGVGAHNTGRSRTVAAYLAALAVMLEEHHLAEDELVWPRLMNDPAVEQGLVERMEEQHERIARALGRLSAALPDWRDTGDPELREAVAGACEALVPALEEHLADEELYVLPLVPERFTGAEWARLSERGRAAVPGSHRLYMLGALSAAAGDDQRAAFLGRLPAPVRLLWRLAGKRLRRGALLKLHGPPPATTGSRR